MTVANASPSPIALSVKNLHKSFGPVEVLKGISLDAHEGDVVSILGSSGSGKSTFLRCINLLETPNSGEVTVAGETIRMVPDARNGSRPADRSQVDRIRSQLGMVFQSFNLWTHKAETGIGGGDVLGTHRRLELARGVAIGIVEDRRSETLEICKHQFLERHIADEVDVTADHFATHRGLGHHGCTLGHLLDAGDKRQELGQVAGTNKVTHRRLGLYHVRCRAACVGHGIVDACRRRHVLAHIVDADIHQFHGIKGTAAEMRRGRSVRGAAAKVEIDLVAGERYRIVHSSKGSRVPANGDVDIIEDAGADHEALGGAALFGRAAIVADTALDAICFEEVLDGGSRKHGTGAEHIVAAAMAIAVRERLAFFSQSSDLAEAGKRVELAEDGNHRPIFASFAHDGCRQAGDAALDAKTFGFELPRMLFGRAIFLIVRFRHIPDAVAERKKKASRFASTMSHTASVFFMAFKPASFRIVSKIGANLWYKFYLCNPCA